MNLTDFLPAVLQHAKGAPDVVAEYNIRLALMEFCTGSTIWREFQTTVETVTGTGSYAYAPAAGQVVVKLIDLTLDGNEIEVVDPDVGRRLDLAQSMRDYAYSRLTGFEIRQVPAVNGSDIVTYSAVAPALTATTVPDVFARFFEAIGRGAAYRMLSTPNRAYTDAPAARDLELRWREDIRDARSLAANMGSRTSKRVSGQFM